MRKLKELFREIGMPLSIGAFASVVVLFILDIKAITSIIYTIVCVCLTMWANWDPTGIPQIKKRK